MLLELERQRYAYHRYTLLMLLLLLISILQTIKICAIRVYFRFAVMRMTLHAHALYLNVVAAC
jgi:hypothetical protein